MSTIYISESSSICIYIEHNFSSLSQDKEPHHEVFDVCYRDHLVGVLLFWAYTCLYFYAVMNIFSAQITILKVIAWSLIVFYSACLIVYVSLSVGKSISGI